MLILLPAKQNITQTEGVRDGRGQGGEKFLFQTFHTGTIIGGGKKNTFINLLALSQGTMLIFHLHSMPQGNTPVQS